MKKLFYCIVALLLIAAPSQAQLLYKISGKGLAQPSYLFGTHHLAKLSIIDSIKGLRPAFESAKQVIGEINMKDMMNPQTMATMQQKMMLGGDSTLLSLLTPEEQKKVDACIKEYLPGATLDMVKKMRPSALSNQLTVIMMAKQLGGFNMQEQLDTHFQKEALAKGKEVAALETMDLQLNVLFLGTSAQRQKVLLMCLIDNIKKEAQKALELTAYYNHQKLDAMYKLSQEKDNNQCDATQAEEDALIKLRNNAWMKKLPEMMKAKSSFIAVGALHLAGPIGLVAQLKKAGYTVTPVK
jgi:uncharacterized protein YbaP (TraB family)